MPKDYLQDEVMTLLGRQVLAPAAKEQVPDEVANDPSIDLKTVTTKLAIYPRHGIRSNDPRPHDAQCCARGRAGTRPAGGSGTFGADEAAPQPRSPSAPGARPGWRPAAGTARRHPSRRMCAGSRSRGRQPEQRRPPGRAGTRALHPCGGQTAPSTGCRPPAVSKAGRRRPAPTAWPSTPAGWG